MKLLTIGNPKTVKGQKKGFMSFIMHLAPSILSGYNTCPMASKGCAAACLNTAGRGRMDNTQAARIRKTRLFFETRESFMDMLVKDIQAGIRKATRENLIPVFRLNGTSDIRWETVSVGGFANIMEMFPNVQFYDYTKLHNRKNIPANYYLTFSRSEDNGHFISSVIGKMNVAVVFSTVRGEDLPRSAPIDLTGGFGPLPVVDGDDTDLRFLDPRGVIVGLRSKGKAKVDGSGFVVAV